MDACGLIVEYNPFHNGHVYHIQEAKKVSKADCMIAVMSGHFLQRGEPAIIDKFHRAKAALQNGVDIVVELPYPFAVQSSHLFATGAVNILHKIGVNSICFGSESGDISNFLTAYEEFDNHMNTYQKTLKSYLNQGLSYPKASMYAYESIGLTDGEMDLSQPNNILGFSYVQAILENELPITPLTIKRTKSNYHDEMINSSIASATSIRKHLITNQSITTEIAQAIPEETLLQLHTYKDKATIWHSWEHYFPFISYRIRTMTREELRSIEGMEEGLENRIIDAIKNATSFQDLMERVKTKRYTWTRLQRTFVHILTYTTKQKMRYMNQFTSHIPYVRLLGITETGQQYLNRHKKEIQVPIVSQLSRSVHPMLELEETITHAYLSVLPPESRIKLHAQEIMPPQRV
ncbi:nucleotidyltransferase [Oceanobacillus halotolerans]|uniref:nucleotidyltransferase n=1 Tax=Oceanobacillus halotolerans TaxID=2663380 RepID=UPI0013DC70EE|nr:nucleotidyltransferase [Oceanobacillus halotolerans]